MNYDIELQKHLNDYKETHNCLYEMIGADVHTKKAIQAVLKSAFIAGYCAGVLHTTV